MKKHCILGATGFIGSHVAEELIKTNESVTAIIRKNSDRRFLDKLGLKIITLDEFTETSLCNAMQTCDVIYNCIANVHPHQSLEQYLSVQVELTETIVNAVVKSGCTRLVQLSSVEVYGEFPEHTIDESYNCHPKYNFQRSLYEREQLLQRVAKETYLDIVILRPVGTFGWRSAVTDMFMQAYAKGKFPVLGDGQVKTSSVDTRDIGRSMVFLGRSEKAKGGIFNLQAYSLTMQTMVKKLDKITGQQTKLLKLPLFIARPLAKILYHIIAFGKAPMITPFTVYISTHNVLLNDDKLRNLGFKTQYDFEDTLRHLLDERR